MARRPAFAQIGDDPPAMKPLPRLRAEISGGRVRCSKCRGREFRTEQGVGVVDGCKCQGAPVVFARADEHAHLNPPITCVACGTEHAARYRLPIVTHRSRTARA